jgi:hypothetical protein
MTKADVKKIQEMSGIKPMHLFALTTTHPLVKPYLNKTVGDFSRHAKKMLGSGACQCNQNGGAGALRNRHFAGAIPYPQSLVGAGNNVDTIYSTQTDVFGNVISGAGISGQSGSGTDAVANEKFGGLGYISDAKEWLKKHAEKIALGAAGLAVSALATDSVNLTNKSNQHLAKAHDYYSMAAQSGGSFLEDIGLAGAVATGNPFLAAPYAYRKLTGGSARGLVNQIQEVANRAVKSLITSVTKNVSPDTILMDAISAFAKSNQSGKGSYDDFWTGYSFPTHDMYLKPDGGIAVGMQSQNGGCRCCNMCGSGFFSDVGNFISDAASAVASIPREIIEHPVQMLQAAKCGATLGGFCDTATKKALGDVQKYIPFGEQGFVEKNTGIRVQDAGAALALATGNPILATAIETAGGVASGTKGAKDVGKALLSIKGKRQASQVASLKEVAAGLKGSGTIGTMHPNDKVNEDRVSSSNWVDGRSLEPYNMNGSGGSSFDTPPNRSWSVAPTGHSLTSAGFVNFR